MVYELQELILPDKFQSNVVHRRFSDKTYFLYSIYAVVMYLYDELYNLEFSVYNVTSHNMVHLVLKYLNSKPDLKRMYNIVDKNVLESFYTDMRTTTLKNKINLLYAPLRNPSSYFIREIDITRAKNIDIKHYANSLYVEPLYYESCIHFTKYYKHMYALPFYSLSSIILIHNVVEEIVSKLKRATIGFNGTTSSASSISTSFSTSSYTKKNNVHHQTQNIFEDVTFNEFNVINDFFFNIKTQGKTINTLIDTGTYPLDIDILIFNANINLTTLVRTSNNEPQILNQFYIMTNVEISKNILVPIIYDSMAHARGIIMSELVPYELNKCDVNTVTKSDVVKYNDERDELRIETLMETPHITQRNRLYQCLVKKNTACDFMYNTPENSDSIMCNMFFYWLGMGYVPDIILSRDIINVSNKQQNIERNYTSGIFVCGDRIYYLKLITIQDYKLAESRFEYLPRGIYISPSMLKEKFTRLTQNIFFLKDKNTVLFSNCSLMNSDINDNARHFFATNSHFHTVSVKDFTSIIDKSTLLTLKSTELQAEISFDGLTVNLTKLIYSKNIQIFIFSHEGDDSYNFSMYDVVSSIITENNIDKKGYKNKHNKVLMFNILNIHELYR